MLKTLRNGFVKLKKAYDTGDRPKFIGLLNRMRDFVDILRSKLIRLQDEVQALQAIAMNDTFKDKLPEFISDLKIELHHLVTLYAYVFQKHLSLNAVEVQEEFNKYESHHNRQIRKVGVETIQVNKMMKLLREYAKRIHAELDDLEAMKVDLKSYSKTVGK